MRIHVPGFVLAAVLALTFGQQVSAQPVDVPLRLWKSPSFPTGLVFGKSNGISWGDYDADGWIDVFVAQDAKLWRNLGGVDWQLVGDYNEAPTPLLLPTQSRYGSSFGDYDNDGLPDLPVEPRKVPGDTCFRMLHNLGGGVFEQVVNTTAGILSSPCGLPSETIGWVDADVDGDLDLFLPVYASWSPPSGPGNLFWTNLGPVGPNGEYQFQETSIASGLKNPVGTSKPEGAQFCDVDGDGDADLFCNGVIYQNRTVPGGAIVFDALDEPDSGIGLRSNVDEGAMLFDHDMDGDYDVFVVYDNLGTIIWENRGDGSFTRGAQGVVASPLLGWGLGMSAGDWDSDGDIDFTAKHVFRRNQLVETGVKRFTIGTHNIPPEFITKSTPAWGDWDLDGDLDCALGNWTKVGRFFENTTYDASTPMAERRFVRVRPVRDSATVARGLETEFGASVEIRIAGETGTRRKQFVASGSGYLNQNEYALHFGLPPHPSPGNPTQDLIFDVVVDFPSLPQNGLVRVDKHVNPALGGIALASLSNREIRVFRSGRVEFDGASIMPSPIEAPTLTATAGGLIVPALGAPLPAPQPAPAGDHFVGIDFDTLAATGPVRIVEIALDGQLDAPVANRNIAIWDVTNPINPTTVASSLLIETTSPANHRSYFTTDLLLAPRRSYRLVARVTKLRATPITGPLQQGPINTNGGLSFQDSDPATGVAVAAATVDPSAIYAAIRFRLAQVGTWSDIGGGLAGGAGTPVLAGTGAPGSGPTLNFALSNAAPSSIALLVVGQSVQPLPLAGGHIVPDILSLIPGLMTDANGDLSLVAPWPSGLPGGIPIILQYVVLDPTGPLGVSLSNALWFTTPP